MAYPAPTREEYAEALKRWATWQYRRHNNAGVKPWGSGEGWHTVRRDLSFDQATGANRSRDEEWRAVWACLAPPKWRGADGRCNSCKVCEKVGVSLNPSPIYLGNSPMATSEKQSPSSALLTACERWTLRNGLSDKGLDTYFYHEQLAAELGDDLEAQGLDGALSLHFADQVRNMDAGDLVNHQRAGYLEAMREMAGLLQRLIVFQGLPPTIVKYLQAERQHLLARVARGRHRPLYEE